VREGTREVKRQEEKKEERREEGRRREREKGNLENESWNKKKKKNTYGRAYITFVVK
jgi:hypothetical protein